MLVLPGEALVEYVLNLGWIFCKMNLVYSSVKGYIENHEN